MSRKIPVLALAAALAFATGCSSADSDAGKAEPAVSPAVLEQGRALYKATCVTCHGEKGKGDGPAAGVLKPPPRDHTDRAYMSTLTDEEIGKIIKMGGAIKGKPLMPSHPQFKDPQLQALVAYVRSLSAPKR
jgi:mono/diheme cytochrome c family protein